MTSRAAGPPRRVPRMWLIPLTALTGLLATVAADVLSRSVVVDLIAWWPVWAVIAVVAVSLRRLRLGKVLLAGVVPLAALIALGVFTFAHMQGWAGLPSTEARLVGPESDGVETAHLEAGVDGPLVVSAGSGFLYRVEPVRRGGEVGVPGAREESIRTHTSVRLTPSVDPGFYRFAGWDILLSKGARWTLDLVGVINADLRGLELESAEFGGEGVVRVGAVSTEANLKVNGVFELVVPPGTAVRVIGDAAVPASWTPLVDGWESPATGVGWVVEVLEGGTLEVTEG